MQSDMRQTASPNKIISIPRLVSAYYVEKPDPDNNNHLVHFGTSGHRGSSLKGSFNETHILAICQAICDYRHMHAVNGPLFLGMDTHALSEPAFATAIEVLAANGVHVYFQEDRRFTPTPVISHAIINFNRQHSSRADGIIITPSHNPPDDGGIKYNPPHGGPAENAVTSWISRRANSLICQQLKSVKKMPLSQAFRQDNITSYDYITPYVSSLENVINMEAISNEKLTIGVHPFGGAGIYYWEPIAEHYNLDIQIVDSRIDPAFSFMPADKDGEIRMDCSSPWAMKNLIQLKEKFDLAIGNDPDFDRHGIVTPHQGLMNANDYLAVCADYLFCHRTNWSNSGALGKTIVTTSLLNHICQSQKRPVYEVPVGFKWYENGLSTQAIQFACEESAGATFLQRDGQLWTTDKDGFIAGLLAAEIMAVTKKDPSEYYRNLTAQYGQPVYNRIQIPATLEQRQLLASALTPDIITATTLAGESVLECITHAPGNKQPIGGIKLSTENGWITIRPSGTESAYKIYAESFKGEEHLEQLQKEARKLVENALSETQRNAM